MKKFDFIFPSIIYFSQQSQQIEKIFSHSPKAQQLRQVFKITDHPSTQHIRQKSVVTLSSHSNSPLPHPDVKHVDRSGDNKILIQTNTRSIAAVAAQKKRKSRTGMDANNNKFSSLNETGGNENGYLSATRLAYHDKKFPLGSDMTLRQLLGENVLSNGGVYGNHSLLGSHPTDASSMQVKYGQGRHKKTVKMQTGGTTRSRHVVPHHEVGTLNQVSGVMCACR